MSINTSNRSWRKIDEESEEQSHGDGEEITASNNLWMTNDRVVSRTRIFSRFLSLSINKGQKRKWFDINDSTSSLMVLGELSHCARMTLQIPLIIRVNEAKRHPRKNHCSSDRQGFLERRLKRHSGAKATYFSRSMCSAILPLINSRRRNGEANNSISPESLSMWQISFDAVE